MPLVNDLERREEDGLQLVACWSNDGACIFITQWLDTLLALL